MFHCALRFLTGCGNLVHHCTLHATTISSLSVRRFSQWMVFIYKSLLGLVPTYLGSYMCRDSRRYSLWSQDVLRVLLPRANTDLGIKKCFKKSLQICCSVVMG